MGLRLAVLGAFPFPVPQGSQAYAADQARALGEAGAEAVLVVYGSGAGDPPRDLPVVRARRGPRRLRSGLHAAKLPADGALLAALAREHRRRPFDAILAHNAEAAGLALAARPWLRAPVVYVAHTLWCHELACYGPPRWRAALDRLGRAVDGAVARSADAVLAVSREGARALSPRARGPAAWIPPGLDPAPKPEPAAQEAACSRFGVRPGGFVLYCGNLDPYQDLDLLAAAARRLTAKGIPVLALTHDASDAARRAPGLRVERAERADMRALAFAAGVLALPRRRPGGFPVKLLNYMEAGRPIVANQLLAEGLEHAKSAWLLPPTAGPEAWAAACEQLLGDPSTADGLGRAARRHLEERHCWRELAGRTLDLVGRVTRA
jgi:glycosyltransferase involved in cell wall biosynthesis